MSTGKEVCSHALFQEDYWLDAVAPGGWDLVAVHDNNQVVGRLPYVLHRRFGISKLTVPPLTPWLGPWVKTTGRKYTNDLSYQHQILGRIIKQLPRTGNQRIPFAPETQNLLPFYWHGYELGVLFTYRLVDITNLDAVWSGFRKSIRTECRKAERYVEVREENDLDTLSRLQQITLERQGMHRPGLDVTLRRVDDVMARRGQRILLVARDEKGTPHGAAYIVHDHRHAFYLAGGGDPYLRTSGAQALLLWNAIRRCSAFCPVFDFEGSMNPAIERFFRAFGARQIPKFVATTSSVSFSVVNALLANRAGRFSIERTT